MLLNEKTAVVTGAGSGMGRAMVKLFHDQGARVAALDLDGDRAAESVARLDSAGQDAISVAVDVSSPQSVADAFEDVTARLGGLDALVNCAGIREIASPLDLDADEWHRVLGVNLDGTFLCSQAAARSMVRRGVAGSIVTISSTAGMMGYENRPAYSASKAGVIGLTRSLARDLGEHGIRVNCISPGLTRTPFTEMYFADETLVRNIPRVVPLARYAEPEDLAKAALFLVSDLASYVSGINLPVDGGHTIVATFNLTGDDTSPFSAARPTAATS
jgi:3-oxoacyl-[acyl-carrier protein] reductase